MYMTLAIIEFFYIIASVIYEIESPNIKETKVVTDLDNELKKITLGNRHIPRRVYARNTGKNYMKKNSTLTSPSLISSYMSTIPLVLLRNLKIVIQLVRQLIPMMISL